MTLDPNWKIIDPAARSLGVSEAALEGWHTRGCVPHKWRLPLIRAGLSIDTTFGEPKRAEVAA